MTAQIRYDVRHVPSLDDEAAGYPIFSESYDDVQQDEERRWPMHSADELGRFRPVKWLIPGWLAAGELSVLYGKGDTYKSFIALTWACQLAASNWPVIYIAAEGVSGLRSRIAAWQVHNRIRSLSSLLVIKQNVALHDLDSVMEWQEEVDNQLHERNLPQPKLVVVDTVARNFVGGDENSAREMGVFVEGCEVLRKGFETAVLPIHHTRKDDTSERGTESLRNASFAMFKTDQAKRRVGGNGTEVRLKCDRMKDAEPPKEMVLGFDQVALPQLSDWQGGLVSSLAMSETFPSWRGAPSSERDDFQKAALAILSDEGSRLGMDKLIDRVRQDHGVSIGTSDGRSLLNKYASDPSVPINHDAGGYGIEGQV